MAKILLVKCHPEVISLVSSKSQFNVIAAANYELAVKILELNFPDTLPEVVVIGNFPREDSYKRTKRKKVSFAQSIKDRFHRFKIICIDGKMFPKKAPDIFDGVCEGTPEAVLEAIEKLLSPYR